MEYMAKLTREDGVYLVSFPDLPHINTYGETEEEALKNAAEALNGTLESDFERGFKVPAPKKYRGSTYRPLAVAPHIQVALTLRALRKDLSQVQLAKKLGVSYQAYQRLENPRRCNPSVKTLEKIAEVLNLTVSIEMH